MWPKSEIRELLERHHLLDDTIAHDRSAFPSDWNGTHPFAREYMGDVMENAQILLRDTEGRYLYFDEVSELSRSIKAFHATREGCDSSAVIAGPGSSSFLAAIAVWLASRDCPEVCYLPPAYYSLHHLLRSLGVAARPIASRPLLDESVPMSLPSKPSVLLITDPIWFAGRHIPESRLAEIAAWQKSTESIVVVDGSFQFMSWSHPSVELSSRLDPERTLRLLCPTKALGIPSFRFAYLILPKVEERGFKFLYESMVGAASVADLAFAKRAMTVLNGPESNRRFLAYLQSTFARLCAEGLIREAVQPDAGYFVFALPSPALRGRVNMDGRFFEVRGYENYIRVNLMAVTAQGSVQ